MDYFTRIKYLLSNAKYPENGIWASRSAILFDVSCHATNLALNGNFSSKDVRYYSIYNNLYKFYDKDEKIKKYFKSIPGFHNYLKPSQSVMDLHSYCQMGLTRIFETLELLDQLTKNYKNKTKALDIQLNLLCLLKSNDLTHITNIFELQNLFKEKVPFLELKDIKEAVNSIPQIHLNGNALYEIARLLNEENASSILQSINMIKSLILKEKIDKKVSSISTHKPSKKKNLI